MKRLMILCNSLVAVCSSSAASFLIFAIMWRNVSFAAPSIIMTLMCAVIVYNLIKVKKEMEAKGETTEEA